MERLFVLDDNNIEREVVDATERMALTNALVSGEKLSRVEGSKRIVLSMSEEASERARWATNKAIRAVRDTRTVIVTIDDGVMPVVEESVELQSNITPTTRTKVKARIAARQGTDQANVLVESLVEYKNRKRVS